MKVRTQQNFNQKTHETVFGISIMPDGGRRKSRRFLPHCQPFRDLNNPHQIIPQWQKDMAHWADRKEIYMSCDFKDFSPRKGFLCKEYFKIL